MGNLVLPRIDTSSQLSNIASNLSKLIENGVGVGNKLPNYLSFLQHFKWGKKKLFQSTDIWNGGL